jgi:beta-lactamase regulating signal transducer with metallopeptidase domain
MQAAADVINSLGRVFVESAWPMLFQSGALILIILAVDSLLHNRVRAVFRYWLWMLVLVKLVLPATLSSPVSIGQFVITPAARVGFAIPEKLTIYKVSAILPSSEAAAEPRLLPPSAASRPLHSRPIAPPTRSGEPIMSLTWQGGVFLLWLTIVGVMLLLLLQRVAFVCGLVRQSKQAGESMKDTLDSCGRTIGVRGSIGLKVSPNTTSPAVCGLLRPVILLPQELDSNLSPGQLKSVLLHELVHIKRDDMWINLLQTVLQIIFFYNPLLWLANWMIRRVREQAVDEHVQVALGETAQEYPETLLSVARLAFESPVLSLRLIGVIESRSALAERIKRMLTRPAPKTAKLGFAGAIIVVLAGVFMLPMARSIAEEPQEQTCPTFQVESHNPSPLKDAFAKEIGRAHV